MTKNNVDTDLPVVWKSESSLFALYLIIFFLQKLKERWLLQTVQTIVRMFIFLNALIQDDRVSLGLLCDVKMLYYLPILY